MKPAEIVVREEARKEAGAKKKAAVEELLFAQGKVVKKRYEAEVRPLAST